MKLLFVGDRRFFVKDEKVYTEGAVGAETGERYKRYFEEVKVVGRRLEKPGNLSSYNVVGHPTSAMVFVPDLAGLVNQARIFKVRDQLREYIKQSDCLIARLPSRIGLEACLVANKIGIPWAVEVGGCTWDAYWHHGNTTAKLYAPIAYLRMRAVVRKAKFASYVTSSFLQERYPAKGVTVGCSNVELSGLDDAVLARRISRIRHGSNKLIFGTVASLHGRFKGVHLAIKALSQLAPDLGDFEYRIVGAGPQDWLQRLAREGGIGDRVQFLGSLPHGKAINQFLDKIDVFLLPSLREGLPRSIIEAMSRGLPCVGSRIAGMPELLSVDQMHEKSDVADLARKIRISIDARHRLLVAERNFAAVRNYAPEVLQGRRDIFWNSFRAYCETV